MRILNVYDHVGYEGNVWHGVTTYLAEVLPRLTAAGFNVALCVLRSQHTVARLLESRGVEVRFLELGRLDPRALSQTAGLVRQFRPDVIHTAQFASNAIGRALKLPFPGMFVINTLTDFDPVPLPVRALQAALPMPDVLLCPSGAVRNAMAARHRVTLERTRVIHHGIDLARHTTTSTDVRRGLRQDWAISLDALVVAMCGRLHPEKRVLELLAMIPMLVREIPEARFVIAGDGPLRAQCEQLVRDLDIGQFVRLLGFRRDIPDVLAASDVSVMLCQHEAFGFAAVESLALGCPVVAYRSGGIPEVVIDGKTGLLAPAGDDKAFAALLVRILRDHPLRRALGTEASIDARRFAIENHIDALTRLYAEATRPAST